jgi:hypothetical protein
VEMAFLLPISCSKQIFEKAALEKTKRKQKESSI